MAKRLKKKVKIGLYILIILLIVTLGILFYELDGTNQKEIPEEKKQTTAITTTTSKKESNKLSMVAVGDCLIHRFVYTDASNGNGTYSFSKMFTEVEGLIKNHDLAFYNQESNIGGKSLGLSAYPRFNSPEEIGDDMVNLGFNMVSLVNNHTLDKGEKDGIRSEMGVVNGNGIVGIVYLTSDNYSVVIPVLNSKSNISCKIKKSDYFGFLKWEGGSSEYAIVKDMPRHSLFSL